MSVGHTHAVGDRVRSIPHAGGGILFGDATHVGTVTKLRGWYGYFILFDDLAEPVYLTDYELERMSVVDQLANILPEAA